MLLNVGIARRRDVALRSPCLRRWQDLSWGPKPSRESTEVDPITRTSPSGALRFGTTPRPLRERTSTAWPPPHQHQEPIAVDKSAAVATLSFFTSLQPDGSRSCGGTPGRSAAVGPKTNRNAALSSVACGKANPRCATTTPLVGCTSLPKCATEVTHTSRPPMRACTLRYATTP